MFVLSATSAAPNDYLTLIAGLRMRRGARPDLLTDIAVFWVGGGISVHVVTEVRPCTQLTAFNAQYRFRSFWKCSFWKCAFWKCSAKILTDRILKLVNVLDKDQHPRRAIVSYDNPLIPRAPKKNTRALRHSSPLVTRRRHSHNHHRRGDRDPDPDLTDEEPDTGERGFTEGHRCGRVGM